jgi:predicted RNA-binding protein with RPS1 domain
MVAFGAFVEIMAGTDGLRHISAYIGDRFHRVWNEPDELELRLERNSRLGDTWRTKRT